MKILLRAALTAALLLPAAHAAPVVLDRIVVVVGEGVILQSELEAALALARQQITSRGLQAPPDDSLRSQVLERLILVRLQTQRAAQAGIRIDDRELNDVLANIARENKMSLAEFAEALRKDGDDYLAVREQVRDEVIITRIRQREVDSRVVVTEQDIDQFLAMQGMDENTEYRLSHLLVSVPDGATAEVRAKARQKIEALRKRIADGEDFAQIAIANSDGQQALQGGDLDWRRAADLPQLFATTAAKLAPEQMSEVLETATGFHLVRLAGVRGGEERKSVTETRARHILITLNAIRNDEQARIQARDVHARLLAGEDFAKLAKEFSDDPGSKNNGGDLGYQPPGVFVTEFQIRLDQLRPEETSGPFRTQFGWHIAQVLERRTRDTTVEARRARARAALQQRKIAEEYDTWLRRLRDEAYVEFRLKRDAEAAQS